MAIIKNKRTKLKVAQTVEPVDLSDVATNSDLSDVAEDLDTLEGTVETLSSTVDTLNSTAVTYATQRVIASAATTTLTVGSAQTHLLIFITETAVVSVAVTARRSSTSVASYITLYDDESSLTYAVSDRVLSITNNLEENVYMRDIILS